ncbi:methyltransferase FkbM family protein [Chondrocystis sp. NIES-4102]|nr:methyltransferase FkbM family protein [Chondrocystis sp. NIES-4102]
MKKNLPTTLLPNNQEVFCVQPGEVKVLYEQIQSYLKYGITLNETSTVFDVGANIGLFSLLINNISKGKAKICSFEPIPKIFQALKLNADKYNSHNIKTFPIGLGKQAQNIEFTYYPNATAISSIYPYLSEKEKFIKILKDNVSDLPAPQNLIKYLPEPFLSLVSNILINFALKAEKVECEI